MTDVMLWLNFSHTLHFIVIYVQLCSCFMTDIVITLSHILGLLSFYHPFCCHVANILLQFVTLCCHLSCHFAPVCAGNVTTFVKLWPNSRSKSTFYLWIYVSTHLCCKCFFASRRFFSWQICAMSRPLVDNLARWLVILGLIHRHNTPLSWQLCTLTHPFCT